MIDPEKGGRGPLFVAGSTAAVLRGLGAGRNLRSRSGSDDNEMTEYEMAEISASMVMELRQRTGLGMMECKKALTESRAATSRRRRSCCGSRAAPRRRKAAGRVAAEGVIGLFVAPDAKAGAMVEVNCETDFVAKNDDFRAFAAEVAQLVARDDAGRPRRAVGAERSRRARPSRHGASRWCRRSART